MSELRQDIVSGDWVLLAPGRADRPNAFKGKKKPRASAPKRDCPLEDLEASGNWPPIIAYPSAKKWNIAVIPNKYPALTEIGPGGTHVCSAEFTHGIYRLRTGVGTHWLLITRDHDRHFADLSAAEAEKVFQTFREIHRMRAKDHCAQYVSSFYNFGPAAGASLSHPHYQILSLPIIPDHTVHSLEGAKAYFKKNKRCVRCDIMKEERREGKRIVGENEHAIAFVPFASKHPFEVTVLPKKHWDSFRSTPDAAVRGMALLLQSVLKKMKAKLGDPDLNFFIHDTPLGRDDYRFHHWHIEVIPRLTIDAGFEFSTSIAINTADPDHAAAILSGKKK